MPVSGHGAPLQERRLNHGLQMLPSGRSAFPVPRSSSFHRSLSQKLPELWSDFSDRGLPEARAGLSEQASTFHGDFDVDLGVHLDGSAPSGTRRPQGGARAGSAPLASRDASAAPSPAATASTAGPLRPGHAPGDVVFAGYAEFDMDGRVHTAGEMDRLMMHAACSKYPGARPATFDEYAEGAILGLPAKNQSGRDVVFVGPGATGSELFHTNTLGVQKCVVPPGDDFTECEWGAASLYGRKAMLCVYPVERIRRQRSIAHFGQTRVALGKSGGLKSAASLAGLSPARELDRRRELGPWASQSQAMRRTDQRFR